MDDEVYMKELDNEFQPNRQPVDGIIQYTEDDYKELQRNLILYKQGNQEAVTYIVRTFHPFITKYTRFIKLGNLPYTYYTGNDGHIHTRVSPTISSFVSLFIDKKEKVTSKKQKKKIFSYTCYRIRRLFSKYEYLDIYNELVLALLNMANKYKIAKPGEPYYKENGTFHMYVSRCFHWEAYRFLDKLIKDPLTHLGILNLKDQFDDMDEEDLDNGSVFVRDDESEFIFERMIDDVSRRNDIDHAVTMTAKESPDLSVFDIESLNFNWTNGVTCSKLFSDLSSYEREILLLSFIEKKTDIEIGKIYGLHRVTVNEHKKKAIRKVQEKAERLNLI